MIFTVQRSIIGRNGTTENNWVDFRFEVQVTMSPQAFLQTEMFKAHVLESGILCMLRTNLTPDQMMQLQRQDLWIRVICLRNIDLVKFISKEHHHAHLAPAKEHEVP